MLDNHPIFNDFQIVDDWYHLDHRMVKKRSADPHIKVHEQLLRDHRVRRAEQQRIKSRAKRDFIPIPRQRKTPTILNDERWSLMWYLVSNLG